MSEGNMITVTARPTEKLQDVQDERDALRELARDFQREIARLKERLKQYGGDLR
jgi:uncharacterized coiled-coil DUF342 family protein